jgi:hypothetical protein
MELRSLPPDAPRTPSGRSPRASSFWIQAIYGGIILLALVVARLTTGEARES